MAAAKTTAARVNRGAINRKKASDLISNIEGTCTKGSACAAVTGSPIGSAALADLTTRKDKAKTSLGLHASLLLQARAAGKTAQQDVAALEKSATTYMNAVDDIAAGDPAIIADAGLVSRQGQAHVTSAAKVEGVKSALGKESREAICTWPAAAGGGAYKLRVNFTPADPTKWEELPSGTSRRRTIVAPTPAAQFLLSVAAIGAEGPGDFSDPIMVTAR